MNRVIMKPFISYDPGMQTNCFEFENEFSEWRIVQRLCKINDVNVIPWSSAFVQFLRQH